MESTIKSKDILNINLTYGCLISLYQALQGVIDEEESTASSLAKLNQRERKSIILEASNSLTSNPHRITEDPNEDGSDVFSQSQSSAGNSVVSGVQDSRESNELIDARTTPRFQQEKGPLGNRNHTGDGHQLIRNDEDSKGDLQSLAKSGSHLSGRQGQLLRLSEVYDSEHAGKGTLDMNAVGLIVHKMLSSQSKEYHRQREKLMPRVKFINDTGKPITFWLSNEKSDFELADFVSNFELKDQMFEIGCTEGTKRLESDKVSLGT